MKPNDLQHVKILLSIARVKFLFFGFFLLVPFFSMAQVSINTDGSAPDASAMLEVKSSSKGILFPRVTLANRPVTPPGGLVIYQEDNSPGIYYYDGLAWQRMSLAAYDFWYPSRENIYFNTGRVGIGTTNPNGNRLSAENYLSGKGAVRGADQEGETVYAEGYLGVLLPEYLGIPLLPYVYNVGVLGIKPNTGGNGAAVYGWNNDNKTLNYGGVFYSDGSYNQATNYGIYAVAEKANQNFAGYFRGRVSVEGNRGSGTGNDTTATPLQVTVKHTQLIDTKAIEGISTPRPGYGIGTYGEGGWIGLKGFANGTNYTATSYGVYGEATGTAGTRIGVYGYANGGAINWAGFFAGSTFISTDLRIGTTNTATGYILSVGGKMACEEVLVQDMSNWPDYVFKPDYKLMDLLKLEESIRENGHLPGLPSAEEIETSGLHLGNMQKQVVEKVEELTLYAIEQGKLLREQGEMLQEFRKEIAALKAENASMKKLLKTR